MFQEFELFATTDVAQRNSIFRDLRANGDAYEKQAVRWSTVRPSGKLDAKGRLAWVNVWFVGHPVNPNQTLTTALP